MNVLVACEFSGIVRDAFSRHGHFAMSCDLLPTERPGYHWQNDIQGIPHWSSGLHWQGDVREILYWSSWDLIIAHPPCTDLCSSGARWFPEKIADGRQQAALDLVWLFMSIPCPKVVIENPPGIISTKFRKPDQIIQPWMFGHGEVKPTHLWLKGLPKLVPTNIVEGRVQRIWKVAPGPDRWKERSRTYEGIAEAMASQWGAL